MDAGPERMEEWQPDGDEFDPPDPGKSLVLDGQGLIVSHCRWSR